MIKSQNGIISLKLWLKKNILLFTHYKRVYDDLEKGKIVFLVGKENVLPEFSLALERANHVSFQE